MGILRFDIKDFHLLDPKLESSLNSKINIEGIVVSEPEHRDNNLRFVLKTNSDKVLVSTNLYKDIKYGEDLKAEGKLQKPGVIVDDLTGKAFDYGKYLSKDDVYYTMSFATVEVVSKDKGSSVISTLLKIKQSFINKMRSILPEPDASLLAGLLVSGKQALPKSILEEFRRAGVVHIVVLSGYNITIVAQFFLRIFGAFGLRIASTASVIGIILFVLMTGATATVVRAVVMALIAISGKWFGRSYSAPRALLVAGFFMLIQNPKILVYDPSFQLSFLATVAMIYVSPVVDKYLTRVPDRFGLKQILSATISTQIFVLPYLLYQIGSVSIVSLFSNILILAFIPFTMLIGFISTLLSYPSSGITLPLTYVTHLLLTWILFVAHSLGNLSFADIKISHFSLWLTLVIYLGFFIFIVRSRNSLKPSPSLNS